MLDQNRLQNLKNFSNQFNISWNNYELLDLAFWHRSYNSSDSSIVISGISYKNNEKLEFLGDSILELGTTSFLFNLYKKETEGYLSKIKSQLVSEDALYNIALRYHFDSLILLGHGEELSGGRLKKSILADCVESVLGSYCIDTGYTEAIEFVHKIISKEYEYESKNTGFKDYKTDLQEYSQKTIHKLPKYRLTDESGPEHNKIFYVYVSLDSKDYGPGIGHSKKEAEHNAAKIALKHLNLIKIN